MYWVENLIIFKTMWPFYLLIVLWVLFGLIALIVPKKARLIYEKMVASSALCKIWGVFALVMGYFMWVGALLIKIPLVAQILAVIAVIKGIVLIVSPLKILTKINLALKMNDLTFRIFGAIALVISYLVYSLL